MDDGLPEYGKPDAVMRALAHELASLQSVATDLEDCMATVVQRSGYARDDMTNRQILQDFDLLTQSLDGLRTFVHQLATAAHGRPTIRLAEALGSIKLGDMRTRLAQQDGVPNRANKSDQKSKEIDLF